jgi:large subunit ribosomal protein L25
VPGVVYGPRTAPASVSVLAKDLEKLLQEAGKEKLVLLNVEDGEARSERSVLIREVQIHPVRRKFLHVDFYEVAMDEQITIEVRVVLKGDAIGLKMGGMLNLLRRALTVRCLPTEIPERISIDVADLDVGQTIHVSDLVDLLPFELVDDRKLAVVSMSGIEGEKTKAEVAAEGA